MVGVCLLWGHYGVNDGSAPDSSKLLILGLEQLFTRWSYAKTLSGGEMQLGEIYLGYTDHFC